MPLPHLDVVVIMTRWRRREHPHQYLLASNECYTESWCVLLGTRLQGWSHKRRTTWTQRLQRRTRIARSLLAWVNFVLIRNHFVSERICYEGEVVCNYSEKLQIIVKVLTGNAWKAVEVT